MAFTSSYVGTTGVGASTLTPGTNVAYLKRVALTTDSLLASIGVYMALTSGSQLSWRVGVWDDNAGAPGLMRFLSPQARSDWFKSSGTARWMDTPVWVPPASTFYWLGVHVFDNSGVSLAYDSGSGSDHTVTSGGVWTGETGAVGVSVNNSGHDFSIRGTVVSW